MSMTTTSKGSTVVGVFEDRDDAREAIEALKDDGFAADAISILSPDKQATQQIADDTGTHAGAGAATGAVTGGLLGGIGGWLLGIGALVIPGVGPFIAAGAFATALGGAAIGAGIGAIAGALMGMGVPEEHAKYYADEAKAGKTLVTVRADTRYDDAQRILRDHGAYDVESRNAVSGQPVMQRTPIDRRPSDRPIEDTEQTISVPVHAERVDLQRRPVVYEEVGVDKRVVQDTEPVSGTVRRGEARIRQDGDLNIEADR